MFAQVFAVLLLLFVREAITQDCTGFIHDDTCYPSGSYIRDYRARLGIRCGATSASGDVGNWSLPNGYSCLEDNSESGYPVTCGSSSPGTTDIAVTKARDFTANHEGQYSCCSDCPSPITAIIFDRIIIYKTELVLPRNILVIPQPYQVSCFVTGLRVDRDAVTVFYQDGSNSSVAVNRESCTDSGYRCWSPYGDSSSVPDSDDRVQMKRVNVRWTGTETTGSLFRPDVNNGDHCFSCVATYSDARKESSVGCIRAPAWAPSVAVDGCTVSWSYPNSDDMDGFIIFAASGTWRTQRTSLTIRGSSSIGSTWSGVIRAYQDIVGPPSDTVTIERCPDPCGNCISCSSCQVCTCTDGWTGDDCCTALDECGGCTGAYEICANISGSFQCVCDDGYIDNQGNCEDINECDVDNGGCAQICTNTNGGYTCSCRDGFEEDGSRCRDIDECALNIHDCEESCNNNFGDYACFCSGRFLTADDRRSCTSLSYGNGYPRQENGMLYGLVNRADDIAEDSIITCALVTCPACTNPVAETDCTYGEEFGFPATANRRRCIVVTATYATSGRTDRDITCVYIADDGGCTATIEGSRVEYMENAVRIHFHPVPADIPLVCNVNGVITPCTNSTVHEISSPSGGNNNFVVCPVNAQGSTCSGCRCLNVLFDVDFYGREEYRYPVGNVCPTE